MNESALHSQNTPLPVKSLKASHGQAPTYAVSSQVHRFLGGGMESVLASHNFAPLVSLQLWVKAGSADEAADEAGIAHVLEHMLFKGCAKWPKSGEIASLVEKAGGDINAYTTFDHTVYYINAPADFAIQGTEILLDMCLASLIDEEELIKELEVIQEEIRRGRDNPSRLMSQNLFSTFYNGTPYGRPVIGFEDLVRGFTRDKVLQFYKKWYTPNNMMFVAAGDFCAVNFAEQVNTMLSKYPPCSLPARVRPAFVPLSQQNLQPDFQKVKLISGPYQEVRFQLAVEAPTQESATSVAWDTFAAVLGHGDTARLTRALRDEQQLVLGIDADVFAPRYPAGMWTLSFYGAACNASQAVHSALEVLEELALTGPQTEELKRVVNAVKAERIYARESVEGIARTIGVSLLSSSKLHFEEKYLRELSKVTTKDIQNIALQVVDKIRRGEFCASAAISQEALTLQQLDWSQQSLEQLILSKELTFALKAHLNQNSESSMAQLSPRNEKGTQNLAWDLTKNVSQFNGEVTQWKCPLENLLPDKQMGSGEQQMGNQMARQLHFNWRKNERLPLVSLCLAWQGGQQLDCQAKQGISSLLAQMLTRGTLKQSYKSFAAELEDMASSISAFSSRDLFGIRIDCLAEHLNRTLDMMLEALFLPAFEPEELQRVVRETQEVLVAQKDSPTSLISRINGPLLFPDSHYAWPSLGTQQTLASISLQDLKEHWHKMLGNAQKFVLSCAGQFDENWVFRRVHGELLNYCSHHQPYSLAQVKETTRNHLPDLQFGFSQLEREQSHVCLSFRAVPLTDARRTALEIAANVLGGQGGRLFMDLRDTRSLAYSVGASQSPSLHAGAFSFYIGTAAAKTQEAFLGLKEHAEKIANTGITSEELERAKASMLGSQALDSQHLHTQASQLCMSDAYGLPFDNFLRFKERVCAVTTSEVQKVFQELLKTNPPILAIVGPAESWKPNSTEHEQMNWTLHS